MTSLFTDLKVAIATFAKINPHILDEHGVNLARLMNDVQIYIGTSGWAEVFSLSYRRRSRLTDKSEPREQSVLPARTPDPANDTAKHPGQTLL